MANISTVRNCFNSLYHDAEVFLDTYKEDGIKMASINLSIRGRDCVSIEIPFSDKKKAYGLLVTIIKMFDFSFMLEFKSISKMEEFLGTL